MHTSVSVNELNCDIILSSNIIICVLIIIIGTIKHKHCHVVSTIVKEKYLLLHIYSNAIGDLGWQHVGAGYFQLLISLQFHSPGFGTLQSDAVGQSR